MVRPFNFYLNPAHHTVKATRIRKNLPVFLMNLGIYFKFCCLLRISKLKNQCTDADHNLYFTIIFFSLLDISLHSVHTTAECEALMEKGWKNRATGATVMNADSSRSHSIFTINVNIFSNFHEMVFCFQNCSDLL